MHKFAVVGLWHETNTFSSVPADYAAFEADALLRGKELIEEYADSQASIAGFIEASADLGFELVPLVHARTGPIGTITTDAFEQITAEIVAKLQGTAWDGVLIANHGAAVSTDFRDADGELARRVRMAVGSHVPIGMALDLHGNLTQKLVQHATVITVYQTNPHVDAKQRAHECAALLLRTVRGEVAPVQWLETPPLVINITRQFTGEQPMLGIIEDAAEAARRPGLLSTSAVQGYPYADVEQMGMSFLAVSDGDREAARGAAQWMAKRAWSRRAEMRSELLSVEEGLRKAVEIASNRASEYPTDAVLGAANIPSSTPGLLTNGPSSTSPVVLMDVGDNILGGSSADSTVIAHVARRLGIRGILQSLYDPEAVQACIRAGVGAEVALDVGAHTDALHGKPLAINGVVRTIATGDYEDSGPTHGGFRYFDDGMRAVVETRCGLTLLLTTHRSSNISRQQMYTVGIRPESFPIVVAKGEVSPRPAYEPIAREIILVNSPGLTSADLASFNYRYRRRPLYPFELATEYHPIR